MTEEATTRTNIATNIDQSKQWYEMNEVEVKTAVGEAVDSIFKRNKNKNNRQGNESLYDYIEKDEVLGEKLNFLIEVAEEE